MKHSFFSKTMLIATLLCVISTTISASQTDSDRKIESSAKETYIIKQFLKGDDIKIDAKNGNVTLTGTVLNEPRKLLAQEAVASLEGVKSVNNKLETKAEQRSDRADDRIAIQVRTVLLLHHNVNGQVVTVDVKDSVVTLGGESKNQAQKQLTTEYAEGVEGVKEVINHMTVAKGKKVEDETMGDKIDDASITAQIKISLLFHRATRVLKTQVKTNDGVVTLSGIAKNDAEKALVTKLVKDVNGVLSVNNQMTVIGS